MKKILLLAGVAVAMLASCSEGNKTAITTLSGLNPADFEITYDDSLKTSLFVLKNEAGMEVTVTNLGARIVSVMVPDKNGNMTDVVLGFDSIGQYQRIDNNFGAAIGRYANRLNKGQITVNGQAIQLPVNNFGHTLHGGPKGWDTQMWKGVQLDSKSVEMSIFSPDGEMNFPGNVNAKVTYTLTDDNSIDVQYTANTDAETIINMTNHSYFNLNADKSQPVTNHVLYINADKFTPVDSTFMTTGEIASVFETPFDFTEPQSVGSRIEEDNQQLKFGRGYDHNWVLNNPGDISQVAARVSCPETGIVLEVYTDQPGIQVYVGNFLDGTVTGKKGTVYPFRGAICLETQVFPDSPNKYLAGVEGWPSAYLAPEETYNHHAIFKFSVDK